MTQTPPLTDQALVELVERLRKGTGLTEKKSPSGGVIRDAWVHSIMQQAADTIERLTHIEAETIEAAFREGFALGDFAGGGQADPRTVNIAWANSTAARNLTKEQQS